MLFRGTHILFPSRGVVEILPPARGYLSVDIHEYIVSSSIGLCCIRALWRHRSGQHCALASRDEILPFLRFAWNRDCYKLAPPVVLDPTKLHQALKRLKILYTFFSNWDSEPPLSSTQMLHSIYSPNQLVTKNRVSEEHQSALSRWRWCLGHVP